MPADIPEHWVDSDSLITDLAITDYRGGRWSPRRSGIFVIASSATLWAAIIALVLWAL
jgi:hypothetical protein